MKYNPTHNEVACRGWRGGDVKCLGKTRAGSGLCNLCRFRIENLIQDLKLAEEFKDDWKELAI